MEFARLNRINLIKVAKTANQYAKVFAGPEWDEISKCPIKGKFYGSEFPAGSTGPCAQCNSVRLKEAYPLILTTIYIFREISKKGSTAFIYKEGKSVLGFGWGYILSGAKFAETKYNEQINIDFIKTIVGDKTKYFYISEIGVASKLQGQGIGGQITRMVSKRGSEMDLPLLLRTINTSSMAYTAVNMGMEAIMGTNTTPKDPENSDRLLFVKRK